MNGRDFAEEQGPFFVLNERESWFAALAFQCLALAYLWDAAGPGSSILGSDHAYFFIPHLKLWLDQARQFTFPLWNPYFDNGTPLFASLQGAVLYPPNILYFFLPFYASFNLLFVFHLGLAGFSMYILARWLGCRYRGALVAGAAYMLGGYTVSLYLYLSTFYPVAWVPLLLLILGQGLRAGNWRHGAGAGLIGTLMFFSGGLETCFMVFLLAGALTLAPGLLDRETRFPGFRWRLSYLAVFAGVFLGLSAVQWLPTLELSQLSPRSGGVPFQESARWSMSLRDLWQLVLVDPFGYEGQDSLSFENQTWLKSIYLGVPVLFLALVFLFSGRRRVTLTAWAVLLLSVLLALGKNGALFPWLHAHVWVFDSIRFPVKFILHAILVLCLSAGLGWERLNPPTRPERAGTFSLMTLCLITGFLFILLFGGIEIFGPDLSAWLTAQGWGMGRPGVIDNNLFNIQRLSVFMALFGLFLFFAAKNPALDKLSWGAVVIVFLDLFFCMHGSMAHISVEEAEREGNEVRILKEDPSLFRIFVSRDLETTNQVRVVERSGLRFRGKTVPHPVRLGEGLYQAGGMVVMGKGTSRVFEKFLQAVPFPEKLNLLRMVNVKYLFTSQPLRVEGIRLIDSSEEGGTLDRHGDLPVYLYRVDGVLPRAFWVDECQGVEGDKPFFEWVSQPDFDPEKRVLIRNTEGESCLPIAPGKVEEKPRVRIEQYGPDRIDLRVASTTPGYVVISDTWYPGWKAWVGNEEKPMLRANFNFRAIYFAGGDLPVRMEYSPASFQAGVGISLLTLMLVTVGFRAGRARKEISISSTPAGHSSVAVSARTVWAVSIFSITFLVFAKSFGNGFLFWDDQHHVLFNKMIQGMTWENLRNILLGVHMKNWQPLTWLSLSLDYQLYGLNPRGYHFLNLLFHSLSAGLVFFLFIRVVRRTGLEIANERALLWTAGFVALFFAVHPLRVESVVWISERKDVLCLFFMLLSIYFYLGPGDESNAASLSHDRLNRSLVFFVLAILSKPMAVTLPAVLLLIDVYPLNRLKALRGLPRLLWEKRLFLLVAGARIILELGILKTEYDWMSADLLPLGDRMMVALDALMFYPLKTLLPFGLVPFYPFPETGVGFYLSVFISASLLFFIAWLAGIRAMKGCWQLAVAVSIYLVSVLPVLGVLQFSKVAMADRYSYGPTLSLLFLAGGGIACLTQGAGGAVWGKRFNLWLASAGILILCLLGGGTLHRISVWKDSFTLFSFMTERYPGRIYFAHEFLGTAYTQRRNFARAEKEFETALALRPEYITAYINYAILKEERGDTGAAENLLRQALSYDPEHPGVYNEMGNLYYHRADYSRAEEYYQRAYAGDPAQEAYLKNLGRVYLKRGKFQQALDLFEREWETHPPSADLLNRMGSAFYNLGRYEEARDRFARALELDPADGNANRNLDLTNRILNATPNGRSIAGP